MDVAEDSQDLAVATTTAAMVTVAARPPDTAAVTVAVTLATLATTIAATAATTTAPIAAITLTASSLGTKS